VPAGGSDQRPGVDVEVVPGEDVDLVVELIKERTLGVPGDDLVQIGRVTAAEQAPIPPGDDLEQGETRDGRNPDLGSCGQPCRHGSVEHLLDAEHVEVVVVRQVDGAIRLLDAAVGDDVDLHR
jgi:predicted Fe-Mo cluster-binding NifX family protein